MRLICPNCGAQYEVTEDAIPPEGRDVQCSNCSHTWFEHYGAAAAAEAPAAPLPAPAIRPARPAPPQGLPAESGDPAPADAPPPARHPPPADEPDSDPAGDDEEDRTVPPPASAPPRPPVSPEIAAILQQEARHEAELRKAERERGVPSQAEMALPPGQRGDERRALRARGEITTARELLPDIEELNASLRSEAALKAAAALAAEDREDAEASRRRGFRRGFVLVLSILAVFALLYAYAPEISARVPGLAEPLAAYTDTVDAGRLWLDLKLQGLTARLQGGGAAE